ncbi:cysteine hydrolase family protein [Desulfopila sp. IMCC35008]|uniref:cysteine hydrolase family protein n=1 Tax=Desulfopila sp. IMCC35008 TaxID=2653858 RepID=UPI0013D1B7B3|nr:cysteine hydrolase family protein [Desulfopila sp. IMCC35008]
MKKTALIIVDIQNDYFPGGRFEQEGANAAAEKASNALTAFREQALPVIHIHHESLQEGAGFFLPGTQGAEIHSSVAPVDGEIVILKHFPNSFRETELEKELRSQSIERVVITGMMTLMCIDATTRAASDLGFEVTVLHDACAARSLEFNGITVPAAHVHAAFLAALNMTYAEVTDTTSFLQTK